MTKTSRSPCEDPRNSTEQTLSGFLLSARPRCGAPRHEPRRTDLRAARAASRMALPSLAAETSDRFEYREECEQSLYHRQSALQLLLPARPLRTLRAGGTA